MVKNKKNFRRLTNEMRAKLSITFLVIMGLFFVLVGRLIYLNVDRGRRYETMVLSSQKSESTIIPYERGKIYDRDENILATNEKLYALVLEPKNILDHDGKYKDLIIDALVEFFRFSRSELETVIDSNPDSYYEVYRKNLEYDDVSDFMKFMDLKDEPTEGKTEEEKEEIRRASKINGISFEESYKRVYPYKSLACRAIGFTSSGNVGNWGIEQAYSNTLNGINGRNYYYFDQTLNLEKAVKNPINGNSVVSTLDLQIQQIIEKKLRNYDKRVGSEMTSILVMDPNNGEILAMASSNPFDLNDPMNEDYLRMIYTDAQINEMKKYTEAVESGRIKEKKKSKKKKLYDGFYTLWRNPVISDTNEPGSTYKPFTVAAGLESGVLKGNEHYYCAGALGVGNRSIHCSHVHGDISLKNSVAKSCNVAMMTIAFKEKEDIFYAYQNRFGFGRKTGVDLPGEADTGSLVYNAKNYSSRATIATNSFGQNFNCTMMQMAAGFCSIINGGYYYQPRIVKQIKNENGDIIENYDKVLLRTTISEETSKTMRSYLRETVETGTGTKAQIEGYKIGGKTGTAEKIPRNKEDYYVSFIGFTPVKKPRVLIYVTIDEPHVKRQADASLAVNLERECMEEIVEIMGIEPGK